MSRFVAFLFALLIAAGPAAAGGKRMIEDHEAPNWTAVGRLNIAGSRFCTATLVSERLAVTAAHCLFNPRTKRAVPASAMTFVAGLRLGGFAAARRVVRTALPKGYVYSEARSARGISSDVALIELSEPITRAEVQAFDIGANSGGAKMSLVSYARDRAHAPSIEDSCATVVASGAMRAISCEVTFGASGAPVIAEVNGRKRVVGVFSASARANNAPVAIAVMVEGHLNELRASLGAAAR